MIKICYRWGNCNVLWKDADWKWSECQLVAEIIAVQTGVDATTLIPPWLDEPWNPYRAGEEEKKKRKRLVELICKVKGIKYNEKKELKDFKVTVEDIKLVVKAVANIDIDLKLRK